MPTIQQIQEALLAKGFRQSLSNPRMFWLLNKHNQRSRVFAQLPNAPLSQRIAEVPFNLLKGQLHLRTDELNRLIDCPLTHVMYIQLLRTKQISM